MKVIFRISVFIATTYLLSGLLGCTKHEDRWVDQIENTVYDTISNLPSASILTYQVTNTGDDVIYSSINNKEKTITVYLPYYYALNYLEPSVTLAAGASITPDPGQLIPVFGSTPFHYFVTGKNKDTATYVVNIVVQQPQFTLTELSSPTTTATLLPNVLQVKGNGLLPNYDATKVYLVDDKGNQIYNNFSPTSSGTSQQMSWFWGPDAATNPALVANTDYWVEVQSYSLKVRMQYPIRINK